MATGLCALARAKLAKYVAELRAASTREKAVTAAKAGFVGSVVTPMRAVAGNASWGFFRHLLQQPAEAGVDHLMAFAKSARTGFEVPTAQFRQVVSALDADGLRVMTKGFKEGASPLSEAAREAAKGGRADRAAGVGRPTAFGHMIQRFVSELSTRLDADAVAKVAEHDAVRYQSPVAQTAIDGAFAILEAADRPWWKLAFDSSVYMQAKLQAVREGLTGAEAKARAATAFAQPTMEMLMRATDDANYATFKDRNVLSTTATSLKRGLAAAAEKAPDAGASPYTRGLQRSRQLSAKAASVGADLVLPFTGVPSSVAAKIGEVSPLGLLSPRLLGGQAHAARALATAGLGSAMWAAGYALARAGEVTGAPPTSPKEKAQWEAERRQPWSVQIDGHWVGLQALGPAAIPLFMGANLARIADEDPDAGAATMAGKQAGFAAQVLTQQTYLQTVGRLIDAVQDPTNKGAAFAEGLIPVPAVIGQANRAADPYVREQNGVGQRLLAELPGGTFALPKKLDEFGEPITRTPVERLSAIASPFPVREARDTPLLAELRRLRVSPGKPGKNATALGVSVPRSDTEYHQLLADVGPKTKAALEELVSSPEYQAANDEDRTTAIEALVRAVRSEANAQYRETIYDDLRAGKDTPQTMRLKSRLPK
jgi:hypothetical protein